MNECVVPFSLFLPSLLLHYFQVSSRSRRYRGWRRRRKEIETKRNCPAGGKIRLLRRRGIKRDGGRGRRLVINKTGISWLEERRRERGQSCHHWLEVTGRRVGGVASSSLPFFLDLNKICGIRFWHARLAHFSIRPNSFLSSPSLSFSPRLAFPLPLLPRPPLPMGAKSRAREI